LTLSKDAVYLRETLRAGAKGHLLKESIDQDLLRTVRAVAQELAISVYTVDAHRGRIMKELALKSSTEIVRFAMRKGLIQ
jgi:DNA-binding NarL/FixJ family response regulator